MNHPTYSILTYPLPEGVYVRVQYPDLDSLLSLLPYFLSRYAACSPGIYTSVIPYDQIPSGDRDPSCYVFASISLGIAELEQRRAGIY